MIVATEKTHDVALIRAMAGGRATGLLRVKRSEEYIDLEPTAADDDPYLEIRKQLSQALSQPAPSKAPSF